MKLLATLYIGAWTVLLVMIAGTPATVAASTCQHDECTTGVMLTAGCSSCVTAVCNDDSFCCDTEWDTVCVGEAQSTCGLQCAPPTPTPLPIRGERRVPARDRSGCQVEWFVTNPGSAPDRFGFGKQEQVCHDGDPACDFKANESGVCAFQVAVCLNNFEPLLPACNPDGISSIETRAPRPELARSAAARQMLANDLSALQNALSHLVDPFDPFSGYIYAPPLTAFQNNFCSAPFMVDVPVEVRPPHGSRHSVSLLTRSFDNTFPTSRIDLSRLKLTCSSRSALGPTSTPANTMTPVDTMTPSLTPTPTRTPPATFTGTITGTPTSTFTPRSSPTPGGIACGNGIIDAGEECDDGGSCLGGSNAGQHCAADSDCVGEGVCEGGPHALWTCADDADCPGGTCQYCVPQGGDGCAANCTTETDVPFVLNPGVVSVDFGLEPGTSGAVLHGLLRVPLPMTGSQTLTVGKQRNGIVPMVVKAASVQVPKINVQGLACACVRAIGAKTCGGSAFTRNGTLAQDCTPGYSNGGDINHDGVCPADRPCTFVHGVDNAAQGIVSCSAAGLTGIDQAATRDDANATTACIFDADCQSLPGSPQCFPDNAGSAVCWPPPSTETVSGSGPSGSGIFLISTSIGETFGACPSNFCTNQDPFFLRGPVSTAPLTTGTASGEFTTANGVPDDTVCECSDSNQLVCSPATACSGPLTVSGAPLDCSVLAGGSASGVSVVHTFLWPHTAIIGDTVVTITFAAQ